MTATYINATHRNAVAERDAARARMNAARTGSRSWRDAEEDLNFWQGKVANMEAAAAANGVAL